MVEDTVLSLRLCVTEYRMRKIPINQVIMCGLKVKG